MNQTTLELATGPHAQLADPVERTGFDIGWDHAHHGLVPPAELLLDGTPVGQGWRAGRAVFGSRTLPGGRTTRLWLQLRTQAWRRGLAFECQQVTPHFLAQIEVERCPVLRLPLGGAAGQPHATVVDRLNPQAGYAAGNLAVLSQRAVQAWEHVDGVEALRRAQRAQVGDDAVAGLDGPAWTRLAVLRSFATPLPFHEAARMPLAVLPPNRVRLLNAPQGLQALVTLQFTTAGWSQRARALAALLPADDVRHDFNLFIGALAPRVLEAGHQPRAVRLALEDAWLHERVQRRWQHFVFSLGEAATASLLQRAAALGLAGVRTLHHAPEQAIEGWALGDHGQMPRIARSLPPAPWRAARPAPGRYPGNGAKGNSPAEKAPTREC
ncbi:MAG: hypothetical protein Q8K96_09210 [Rubrivivax sp.]|nr:hypothetical protein [Rubrivivax sp.]